MKRPVHVAPSLRLRQRHVEADKEVTLEGVQASIERARSSMLVILTITMVVFVACWNANLSWTHNWVPRELPGAAERVYAKKMIELVSELNFVQVPLFGAKFSADDAAAIGSSGILVASIWMFYCFRRENHALHDYLRALLPEVDAEGQISDRKRKTLEQALRRISSMMVFTSISNNDAPAESIFKAKQNAVVMQSGIRSLLNWVFFSPVVVLTLLLVLDILSLLVPSEIRAPLPTWTEGIRKVGVPALERCLDQMSNYGEEPRILRFGYDEIWGLLIHDGTAFALTIGVTIVLCLTDRFRHYTTHLLREADALSRGEVVPLKPYFPDELWAFSLGLISVLLTAGICGSFWAIQGGAHPIVCAGYRVPVTQRFVLIEGCLSSVGVYLFWQRCQSRPWTFLLASVIGFAGGILLWRLYGGL